MSRKRIAAAIIVLFEDGEESEKIRKREFWVKQWLQKRERLSHMRLVKELRETAENDFKNYLRMDSVTFQFLFNLVGPIIAKKDTHLRAAIPPQERLIATLRYLATGRTLEDLKFSTIISAQALGRIIPETCEAIFKALQPDYMKFPANEKEWKNIANQFYQKWNFPNCGGALDGRHIAIEKPPNSGLFFYNYKGYFSIVLMALANANYEFVFIDVGKNGRISDGGVLEDTVFKKKLYNNALRLPGNSETIEGLNFIFVGDEAFSLHEYFIKPFPMRALTYERKIYNYRLSRARTVIENAFGIMASRFWVLHSTITFKDVRKVESIVKACCILHNFLRKNVKAAYSPPTCFDIIASQ